MNQSDELSGITPDDGPEGVPMHPDLIAATDRARCRTAAAEVVSSFTERMQRLEGPVGPLETETRRSGRRLDRHQQWIAFMAGCLFLAAVVARLHTQKNDPKVSLAPLAVVSFPIYSSVTTTSLAEIGYQRIEEDLDRAKTQVETVADEIAMAAVRQEIQENLDQYCDWSH